MTEHQITVNGHVYRFELHPHASGPKVMVEAPGLAPFDVEADAAGLATVRDILRSVYAEQESRMSTGNVTITGRNRPEFDITGLSCDDARDIALGLRLLAQTNPRGRSVRQNDLATWITEQVHETLGWDRPGPVDGNADDEAEGVESPA